MSEATEISKCPVLHRMTFRCDFDDGRKQFLDVQATDYCDGEGNPCVLLRTDGWAISTDEMRQLADHIDREMLGRAGDGASGASKGDPVKPAQTGDELPARHSFPNCYPDGCGSAGEIGCVVEFTFDWNAAVECMAEKLNQHALKFIKSCELIAIDDVEKVIVLKTSSAIPTPTTFWLKNLLRVLRDAFNGFAFCIEHAGGVAKIACRPNS